MEAPFFRLVLIGKISDAMKNIATVFLLNLLIIPLYSQFNVIRNDANQDYVINMSQDTIWGELRYGNHVLGSRLDKVILYDEDGNRHKFKAYEALGFSKNKEEYNSIKVDGYSYFAQKVVSGTVNMYFFEYCFASNDDPVIQSGSSRNSVQGKIISVMLERDGNVHRIFKNKVSRDVYPFLGDHLELMHSLENGECGFDDLAEVVSAYNEWLEDK